VAGAQQASPFVAGVTVGFGGGNVLAAAAAGPTLAALDPSEVNDFRGFATGTFARGVGG
jgi:hypothetical protein